MTKSKDSTHKHARVGGESAIDDFQSLAVGREGGDEYKGAQDF